MAVAFKRRRALVASSFSLSVALSWSGAFASTVGVEERLRRLEAEIAKLRKEAKDAREQARAADRKATNVSNAAPGKGDPAAPPPPPPVFVSFKNGLLVETEDKAYSFKVGGRIYVDGGASTMPERGISATAAIGQARLEVEGKVAKYWGYKLQYDFANTSAVGAIGGLRDVYLYLSHPALTPPFSSKPITIQVGNFFEPMGLERQTSKNFIPFIEKTILSDSFVAVRHIGAAAMTTGSNWSAKVGVFSTSVEDKALNPSAQIPVPLWVKPTAGWVVTGGRQYYDISGRVTYAPIMEADRLLHLGASGRYHRPNDATGASDDRVLTPGANSNMEANTLKENLLGAPDLSCGAISYAGLPAVAGKCVRDVQTFGGEISAIYGPLNIQAEYMNAHYDRKNGNLLAAAMAGAYAPGGSSLDFSSYYIAGSLFLTGETRASAYQLSVPTPGIFGQVKIKHPLSSGGFGAFEVVSRYSSTDLNNGPFQGSTFANLIALAPNAATRAYVAGSSVNGGREDDLTVGLNWYPDPGFRVMANWTRVMRLAAPWDRAYLNGAHPNAFVLRTQVYW